MTNSEFSNQFDVLYNNIMSNQAPGLDEYEKSVFLTKAQDEVVLAYFNPKGNKFFEGFDGSEQRQIDFSMLMKTAESGSAAGNLTLGDPIFVPYTSSAGAKSVTLPSDIMLYINERVTVTRGGSSVYLNVIPISYDEYGKQMSKPFKRPVHYQAWRLLNSEGTSSTTRKADLVAGPNDTITKYTVRYVKRPCPIILEALSNSNLSIHGVATVSECELDPILHEAVLQRAVELAKAAYTGDLNSQVALGNASQTNIGITAASK